MNVGQVVSLKINSETVYGWVRTEPTATSTGEVVRVELLPDFAHLLPTGWTDAKVAELTPAKVCGCATLGQRRDGQMFTTGCDFSRTPKGTFLPGHDARAKSFLIKAWGHGELVGGFAHALEAAWTFSDAIAAKVAAGIDNAKKRDQARYANGRSARRVSAKRPETPATCEDKLTPAQQLLRDLRVTQPMVEALVSALVRYDGDMVGVTTGTLLALQKRGLVERGGRGVTQLGRRAVDYNLEPESPACRASDDYHSPGAYPMHWNVWDREVGYHCRRCGTADANP